MARPKPVPEGYHTITPQIVVKGAADAINFYKKAFGAVEHHRSTGPDGNKIMHAEIQIGDSILFVVDELPEMAVAPKSAEGTPSSSLHLYVDDVNAVWERAVNAGAQVAMPLEDAFWGDRFGKLIDPFGHVWSIASHIEDVSPEEVKRRSEAFFKEASKA